VFVFSVKQMRRHLLAQLVWDGVVAKAQQQVCTPGLHPNTPEWAVAEVKFVFCLILKHAKFRRFSASRLALPAGNTSLHCTALPNKLLLLLLRYRVCAALQDLQIHGNEPCALFDLNDPFWDRYGQSPLSLEFVPQQSDFILRSPNEVLLLHWKFNKTAWVQNSQGPHGVVKAVGNGYWLWEDVLVTWSKAAAGPPKGGTLTAAIVVPIVVVALAAAGVGFLLWRRCAKGLLGMVPVCVCACVHVCVVLAACFWVKGFASAGTTASPTCVVVERCGFF
jgi:hypothetical protein